MGFGFDEPHNAFQVNELVKLSALVFSDAASALGGDERIRAFTGFGRGVVRHDLLGFGADGKKRTLSRAAGGSAGMSGPCTNCEQWPHTSCKVLNQIEFPMLVLRLLSQEILRYPPYPFVYHLKVCAECSSFFDRACSTWTHGGRGVRPSLPSRCAALGK